MANYENKLGEWFKQVEKRAEEHRAKKKSGDEPKEALGQAEPQRVAEPVRLESAAPVISAVDVMDIPRDVAVATESDLGTGSPRAITQEVEPSRPLFDDSEIPVDFISYLSRSGHLEPEVEPEPTFEVPRDQGTLKLAEGTGEPRPIVPDRERVPPPVIEPKPVAQAVVAPEEPPVRPVFVTPAPEQPKPVPQPRTAPAPAASASKQENWDRVPHHLQTLFSGGQDEEVAQNSYKTFKESRSDLVQRLLDPTVSLEEAARVLNVCPTTVRRYTNRGILKHYRTAGNQRRFRLSDVLTFMEANSRGTGEAGD